MYNLTSLKENHHFGFVTIFQKPLYIPQLEIKIVLIGVRPKLDFLHVNDFLFLFSLVRLFAGLVLVLAVIHDPTNRRVGVWGNFYKIHIPVEGHAQGFLCRDSAHRLAIIINHGDFPHPNHLINALLLTIIINLNPTFIKNLIFRFNQPGIYTRLQFFQKGLKIEGPGFFGTPFTHSQSLRIHLFIP